LGARLWGRAASGGGARRRLAWLGSGGFAGLRRRAPPEDSFRISRLITQYARGSAVCVFLGDPIRSRLSRRCPTVFPFLSGMAKGTEAPDAATVSPDPDRLRAAAREARDDAAPFVLAAAGILTVLALVSRHAHWDLLGHRLWWMWLLVAAPYVCLSATLLFGLGRLVR